MNSNLTSKHGIFASSDGLQDMEEVKIEWAEDGSGMDFIVRCDSCGRPLRHTVTWPELVACAEKRLAPGWYVDQRNGLLRLNQVCHGCRDAPIPWGTTPKECEKLVVSGIEAGKLTRQQVQAWVEQISRSYPPA